MVSVGSFPAAAEAYIDVLSASGATTAEWDVTFTKKIGEGADGEVLLGQMACSARDTGVPGPSDENSTSNDGPGHSGESALEEGISEEQQSATQESATEGETARVPVALKRIQLDTRDKLQSAMVELMVLSSLRNRGVVGMLGWKVTRTRLQNHKLKSGLPLSSAKLSQGQQMITPELIGEEVDLHELMGACATMPRDVNEARLRSRRRLSAQQPPRAGVGQPYKRSNSLPHAAMGSSRGGSLDGIRAKLGKIKQKLSRLPSMGSSRASSPGYDEDWSISRRLGRFAGAISASEAGDSHASSFTSSTDDTPAMPHMPDMDDWAKGGGDARGSWLRRKIDSARNRLGSARMGFKATSPRFSRDRSSSAAGLVGASRPGLEDFAPTRSPPISYNQAFFPGGGGGRPSTAPEGTASPLRRGQGSLPIAGDPLRAEFDAALDDESVHRGSLSNRGDYSSRPFDDDAPPPGPAPVYHLILALEHCTLGSLHDLPGEAIRAQDRDFVIRGRLMRQLANAVAYLHDEAGVLHLDLKPKNVLLMGGDGRISVRVADLALARLAPGAASRRPGAPGSGGARGEELRRKLQGVLAPAVVCGGEGGEEENFQGTTGYAPPEVLQGGSPDEKADIYAMGMIAYQVATGSAPWVGLHHAQVAFKVLSRGERPAWDDKAEDDVPREIRDLVERCWHQDKSQRPTAAQVVDTLTRFRPAARRSNPVDKSAASGRAFGRSHTVAAQAERDAGMCSMKVVGTSYASMEELVPRDAAGNPKKKSFSRCNSLRTESTEGGFDEALNSSTTAAMPGLKSMPGPFDSVAPSRPVGRASGPAKMPEKMPSVKEVRTPAASRDMPIVTAAELLRERPTSDDSDSGAGWGWGAGGLAGYHAPEHSAGDVAGRVEGMPTMVALEALYQGAADGPAHRGNYSHHNSPVEMMGAGSKAVITTM